MKRDASPTRQPAIEQPPNIHATGDIESMSLHAGQSVRLIDQIISDGHQNQEGEKHVSTENESHRLKIGVDELREAVVPGWLRTYFLAKIDFIFSAASFKAPSTLA